MSDAKAEPRVYNYFELLPEQDRFRGVEFVKKNDFDRANLLNVFYLEGLEKAQSELANLKAELEVLRADYGTCSAERDTLKAELEMRNTHYENLGSDYILKKRLVEKLRAERDLYLKALTAVDTAPSLLDKDDLGLEIWVLVRKALSDGAKLAERKD